MSHRKMFIPDWGDAVAIANGFAAAKGRRYRVQRAMFAGWLVVEVGL